MEVFYVFGTILLRSHFALFFFLGIIDVRLSVSDPLHLQYLAIP